MTDLNTSITITNELNVPDSGDAASFGNDINDNDDCGVLSTGDLLSQQTSSIARTKPKSADRVRRIPPRLSAATKSQSFHNFASKAPLIRTISDETPTITITAASGQYRRHHPPLMSSASFSIEHIESDHLKVSRKISARTSEFKLSAHRKRINSMTSNGGDNDDTENDDQVTPQLRIRSSIVSLFGRMGRLRRPSSFSTTSNSNNDIGGSGDTNETNHNSPSLRALPQIAAAKILRAFSYVGKKCIRRNIKVSLML